MLSWKAFVGPVVSLVVCGALACSSSSSSSASGCSALATCCGSLTGAEATSCATALAGFGSSDSACGAYLVSLQSSGECGTGITVTTTGSTSSGGSGTGASGPDCINLAACCANLPDVEDPAHCGTVAASGTDQSCLDTLTTYKANGYCAILVSLGADAETVSHTGCYPNCTMGEYCSQDFTTSTFVCKAVPDACAGLADPCPCMEKNVACTGIAVSCIGNLADGVGVSCE